MHAERFIDDLPIVESRSVITWIDTQQ